MLKDYKDLKSDAARRLWLDLEIAFWNRAKHSPEENQKIIRALRNKYDAQHGEGASARDLGLKPFLELSEVVEKQIEALEEQEPEAMEQPIQDQIPAGYESWFRPTPERKKNFDYFYGLALPALGGEVHISQSTINARLLSECKRLYLIDSRTNPKAAEEFAAISSVNDILTYLSRFSASFDEGWSETDEFAVAAKVVAEDSCKKDGQ